MTGTQILITDNSTILDAGLLAALSDKGNLRGVRAEGGGIWLYVSPPKPGSTGFANFFAKLGMGPLHERRMLAAEAIEKLVGQTAMQKPGDPAVTSSELLKGIPTDARGAVDITTEQLEKAWGLPKGLKEISAYLNDRGSGREIEKYNDLAKDVKNAKSAGHEVALNAFKNLRQQEVLKAAKQEVSQSHWREEVY